MSEEAETSVRQHGTWSPPALPPVTRKRGLTLPGLFDALTVLVIVASFLGLFAADLWVAELTTHFRIHYVALLLPSCFLALARRRWRLAFWCFVGLVLSTPCIPPGCHRPQVPWDQGGQGLRVLSMNVLASNDDYERIRKAIEARNPDVLVVIELTPEGARELESIHGDFPHRVLEPSPGNFGIGLFSRLPLVAREVIQLGPAELPSIEVRLEVGGRLVTLLATHPLPPTSAANARARNEQLEAVGERCREMDTPVVLIGDLNTTPWSPVFGRLKGEGFQALRDTLAARGWQPTWPAPLRFAGIPIDHCLVSREWRVAERATGPAVGGDHLPLFVDLRLP